MDVMKPFLLVASVAFFVGFATYCAAYRLANPPDAGRTTGQGLSAPIAIQVPDDWSGTKKI